MAGLALNLDSFPNSAYAEQLRRGFPGLRFPPPMEAEFARFQLASVIARVRIWQAIMLVIMTGVLVIRFRARGTFMDPDILARVLVLLPCSVLLYVATLKPFYERWYPRALTWVAPLLYLVAMVLASQGVSQGRAAVLVVPCVAALATSFFIGAQFYRATALTGLVLACYIGGALAFGATGDQIHYQALVLGVIWVVGCALGYSMEKTLRISFLQNGLLGEMVSLDGLTGLHNRRAFDQHLVNSWQQALRDRRTLGVLMIDVDHFKRFNDRYGHQAGDATLKRVAGVVQEISRRPLDLAARYGGEEFAVILYDLADDAVEDMAERIRSGVQQLHIEHGDSPYGAVTASIGVALVRPTLERNPRGAVQLADEALYQAKNEGRNRVRVLIHEQSALTTGQFRHRAVTPGA